MAYVANKPVRFDKTYAIGEIIPDGVIDPKMEKRLLDWGKITKLAEPTKLSDEPNTGNEDTDGKLNTPENTGEEMTSQEVEQVTATNIQQTTGFVCDVCGKTCATKTALTAHKKTHSS
ncbi:MAG: C2H2-type zinc finger protein [Oscillospiraceae bacterium]|jgi:hypothetical protein|nr:C2H2-type zinc finger protein [Oscillospiraceae bacterium]